MNFSNSIRQKRFKIRQENSIYLGIKNKNHFLILGIQDISLQGISAKNNQQNQNIIIDQNEILQDSKIILDNAEISLGRILLKYKNENQFGFSCIDKRLPIETTLSKYIEALNANPYDYEVSPQKFSIKDISQSIQESRDLFAKCQEFSFLFKEWEKTPQYQYKTIRDSSKGKKVFIKNYQKPCLVLGSNDYLGLASHPRVIESAKKALDTYGFGSTGSPLTTGLTSLHEELCEFLSKLLNKEKVLLFNSGYITNLGTIQGITTKKDLIISDFLTHASLQDGIKLSESNYKLFRHNSITHLNSILKENRDKYSGCLIVTEGVFSMDGDTANLEEIYNLAQKYDARVFLDEAHSLGVIGENGMGLAYDCNLLEKTDIIMGTFSKCFGGIGGFIATDKKICDWIYWMARSHVFSVSLPPSTIAGVLEAGKIFLEKNVVQKLQENIQFFVKGLIELGVPISKDHRSCIVPIIIKNIEKLGKMNQIFIKHGIFVPPIVFPAVSQNSCRFRFTINASLSEADITYVLDILKKAFKQVDFYFE